ncbi:MAG: sodium:proton antiporter [Phycisphaeraceae bacterium]|nr:sodium:proton antiporter [Phycisphaeraceae bacterium]
MSHDASHHAKGFHGPLCWVISAIVGALIGYGLTFVLPANYPAPSSGDDHPRGSVIERRSTGEVRTVSGPGAEKNQHGEPGGAGWSHAVAPTIPLVLCIPFALLLGSIALMPFISLRFWHHHYPDFAFFLGSAVLVYYLVAFGGYGRHEMLHVGLEYYSFIALVGGLYVVSGGIMVNVRARGTPLNNALVLAGGAVLANLIGTTGASVVLIRPFMRMNAGRLRPIHVVMFIFIVSNCGGCLTPIGDPPLYLGYLKGVPFAWTLTSLWPMWIACVGGLLAVFIVIDTAIGRTAVSEHAAEHPPGEARPLPVSPVSVHGASAVICLALLVAGVFIDPLLKTYAGISGLPVGATFQIIVAATAYAIADRKYHDANSFNFEPIKEVGLLFVGIFATMAPALGYLQTHGGSLGLETPTQFFFATGVLSAVLDNAPTYLSFLQVAFAAIGLPVDPEGIRMFIDSTYTITHADGSPPVTVSGPVILESISLAAVFFGAMTYIGNGPNFMVKSIAESNGLRMPSFIGYVGYAVVLLAPVIVVVWAIFIK